jgi:hypothetical protein
MSTLTDLIEAFRKETEDLVQANIRNVFKAKSGTKVLAIGDNSITIPVGTDDNYDTADEYEIRFKEALDGDGIKIDDALTITSKTSSGFVVNSPRTGTLKWETFLTTPDFNFHT